MTTTTHRIPVNSSAYVDISVGAPNVSLIVREQNLRVIVGNMALEPAQDTDEYLKLSGSGDGRSTLLSVTDLDTEDAVWVRNDNDDEETDLRVVRGSAKILFG